MALSTIAMLEDVPCTVRLALALLCLLLVYLQATLLQSQKVIHPPSPPSWPILGSIPLLLPAIASKSQHLLFNTWARQYGELVRVKAGPITQYMLNSDRAVKEILDKNSSVAAERPRWIMAGELLCNNRNVLLLNGSDLRWRQQRKLITSGMTSPARADAGLVFLNYETARFLQRFAEDEVGGDNLAIHLALKRYVYSTFASIVFGMDVPDERDPVIDYISETGLNQILATLPGRHIVDALPFLHRLPQWLKPWELPARDNYKRAVAWGMERAGRIKEAGRRSVARDSFLSRVIEDEALLGLEDVEEAAFLSLELIIGAADTSAITTWSFLEAMLRYPTLQKKAQAETDAVVKDRLPVWEDAEKIPYIKCMMKETWRWRPPVALGHPHVTTADIQYGSYTIPSGSRLHLNAWAIQHDPQRHRDPDTFVPERYADDPSTTMQSINSADVAQRDHFAFGSGRRICPGYHVAERSICVAMMRILWAFDVVPAEGAKLPLDSADFRGDMPGTAGVEMPVNLRVRSAERKRVIDDEVRTAFEKRGLMDTLG